MSNALNSPSPSTTASTTSPTSNTSTTSNSPIKKVKKTRRGGADCNTARIGFIGAGKMAQSLIHAMVSNTGGQIESKRIYVAAPSKMNTDQLVSLYPNIHVSKRNIDIFGRFDCDLIFICCSSNVIRNLYRIGTEIRPAPLTTNYIPNMRHMIYVFSSVFGFSIEQMKKCLLNPETLDRYRAKFYRFVFTPTLQYAIGCNCCYLYSDENNGNSNNNNNNSNNNVQQFPNLIQEILQKFTEIEFVSEQKQMDIICTIVGAGLAFCYYFINSMVDGAVKLGMPRHKAINFLSKISQSTSMTIIKTAMTATKLQEECSNPSSGAIYGQSLLDQKEISSGIVQAFDESFRRSQSLANGGGGGE